MVAPSFDTFSRELVEIPAGRVCLRRAGSGPVVLLLHGYPETSLAWRKVAPALAREFTVVAADLPGYGDSTWSSGIGSADRISKRMMARMLADAMTELGVPRFAVVGHDRGARVAYRMSLDLPDRIEALAVLDILPILDMAERLTYEAAKEMSHWFWMAQGSDVPERLIGRDPELYLRSILEQWGAGDAIEEDAVNDYLRCMRKPEVLRAISAEYRGDELDLEHDAADRQAGRRIRCPLLAVWAGDGLVERFGDPLAIWRRWAGQVSGRAIHAGHFLMEESPGELVDQLIPFLAGVPHPVTPTY